MEERCHIVKGALWVRFKLLKGWLGLFALRSAGSCPA